MNVNLYQNLDEKKITWHLNNKVTEMKKGIGERERKKERRKKEKRKKKMNKNKNKNKDKKTKKEKKKNRRGEIRGLSQEGEGELE